MSEKEYMAAKPAHNIIMENRRQLNISGVKDVDSFDEESIILLTEMGELTIRGLKLNISRLSQETGEMSVDGEISELVYSDVDLEPRGFFGKLFR